MSGFAELVPNLVVGKLRLKEPLIFGFVCEVVPGLGLMFLGISTFLPVPGVWLVIGALCIAVSAAFIDIPLITSIQTSNSSLSRPVAGSPRESCAQRGAISDGDGTPAAPRAVSAAAVAVTEARHHHAGTARGSPTGRTGRALQRQCSASLMGRRAACFAIVAM